MEENVEDISSWHIDSFEKLKASKLHQKAIERSLQIAVEAMIDISERILSIAKVSPQKTAADNLIKLQELGVIIDAELYLPMIRFRNFIVHRYEQIDLEVIYGIIKQKLQLFTAFAEEIRKH